jgi:hypothetical protein
MTSSTKNKPGTPFPPDAKHISNSSNPARQMLSKEMKDKQWKEYWQNYPKKKTKTLTLFDCYNTISQTSK